MLRQVLVLATFGLLAVGCGDGPPPDSSNWGTFRPPEGLLAFTGTADDSGHVMLPAGARAECNVHHAELADDVIAVLRGLPYLDTSGYAEAQEEEFPHDATLFYGGCGGGPMWVAVSYCPSCRIAELTWEQAAADAGRRYPYDAEMRERIRAEIETLGPAPALPAR